MDPLKLLICMVCALWPAAVGAQVRVLTDVEMDAAAKRGKIVTNAELDPAKEFQLLVIGDTSGGLVQMLSRPQTVELRAWSDRCDVIPMVATDARTVEHHGDLLRKHPELPIVALKDRDGGVWWSASGSQIPAGEVAIAQTLNAYAQATQAAKQKAPAKSNQLNQSMVDAQSYYLPKTDGPRPYNPESGRRPLINPNVNVTVPQTLPQVEVEGSVDDDTRRAVYFIGAAFILCATILAFAILIGCSIMANAVTDDAHDKTVAQQLQSVMPNGAAVANSAAQLFSR